MNKNTLFTPEKIIVDLFNDTSERTLDIVPIEFNEKPLTSSSLPKRSNYILHTNRAVKFKKEIS